MTHAPTRRRTSTSPVLLALQILSALTVLELLWQFATAGQVIEPIRDRAALELHETGAIVLHVLTGLVVVAAIAAWRTLGAPVWLPVLAAVAFVLSFVQAYLGDDETLWLHVPGALVLSVGSIVILAWSLLPSSRASF